MFNVWTELVLQGVSKEDSSESHFCVARDRSLVDGYSRQDKSTPLLYSFELSCACRGGNHMSY